MKNTVKSITTICFFFTFLSCDNEPMPKAVQFSNSDTVFDYVGYADEMIIDGYHQYSLGNINEAKSDTLW